jgi:hypothetical protein
MNADAENLLPRILAGELSRVCVLSNGTIVSEAPPPRVLLAGSFNPLHEGHRGMARLASVPVAFELSVTNVEKPPLTLEDVHTRLTPFIGFADVWLTRAPTFVEKARLFPGVLFLVGADTAARLVQPRFYGDSAEAMHRALHELREHGCRFLVAGRWDGQQFVDLAQLVLPTEFADLFEGVSESAFRVDISSTQLRVEATFSPLPVGERGEASGSAKTPHP